MCPEILKIFCPEKKFHWPGYYVQRWWKHVESGQATWANRAESRPCPIVRCLGNAEFR